MGSDAKDVSVRGLEVIKKCKKVFLEAYTSVLLCPTEELEEFYGRKYLISADRTMVEQESDNLGIAHYATPGTQNKSDVVGLRILHRTTIMDEAGVLPTKI